MKFSDIIGQEENKKHLQNAIAMEKVSHAYIISGEQGSGKRMLAEAFAQTLLCEKGGREACGECHSCRQAASHNHPDIIYVTHEKPATIGVDDVRHQINDTIIIKPYSSRYKIYIVDEAEKMNVQAQNALLKTIEEPPAYAVILLLTTNDAGFLPTILSRCVSLSMKPATREQIQKMLMEQYGIPDYQAKVVVAFAQGNVGKAVKLAASSDFNEMKDGMVQLVKRISDIDLYEMSQAILQIKEYKLEISDYLDFITLWFRDVLLYKATQDADQLIFRDEIYIIKDQSVRASYQGLEEIISALGRAKVRLNANVNFELAMELLLLTIKENLR